MTRLATADPVPAGRQECERRLTAMLDAAVAGRPCLATLPGHCGNGQQALVRRLIRAGADRGLLVLEAGAGRAEHRVPYAGVRRMIGSLTGVDPDREARPGCPPPGLREAVNALRDRPALIVIRDSRRLDAPSRRWLRAFVRRLPGRGAAVLFGGVHVAEEADWLGVRALHDLIPVADVELRDLTSCEVERGIEAALGAAPDAGFTDATARLSAGRPDVLDDMLRLLRAGRREPVSAAVPELDGAAASAWAERVSYVLRELGDDATAALRAVAVCDGLLDLPLVYTLVEPFTMSADRMRAVLDASGLTVADGDRLRIVAPQVTDRLLADLPAGERADLHARAAGLAHLAGAADEHVAGLLLPARPVGARWAVHRLRQSSAALCRLGRYQRAREHLSRALDEPLDPELRSRLGIELAGVEAVTAPEASDRRLTELARLDGSGSVPAAVSAIDLCLARGDADRARRSVLHVLEHGGGVLQERLLALGALADGMRSCPAEPALPRMPALPAPPVDPMQAGAAALSLAVRGLDRPAVVSLARRALGARDGEVMPRLAACQALVLADELDDAEAALDHLIDRLRGGHANAALSRALVARAELHLRRGLIDLATRDARHAEQVLPMSSWHPLVLPQLLALRVMIDVESGRTAAALELAASPVPAGAEAGPYWPFLLFARAMTAWADGRPSDAAELLHHCGRTLVRQGWPNPALLPWRALTVHVSVQIGDHDGARRMAAEEVRLARRWGSRAALGWAELTRLLADSGGARQGDPDEDGICDIHEAVAMLRRPHGRISLGWALAELAQGQLARGDHEAARQSLIVAAEIAAGYPAGRLAQRLRPLHDVLREHATRQAVAAPGSPPEGLLLLHPAWATLSEKDRLAAVLAGRGNPTRHIAALLAVSERTVELRLSRVYRAMRLSGRRELRALVQAAGSG
ncbi:hypothetical protein [Actinoplanes sp. NPDC049118]|uniref:hypothetical protein n=1 Tax=Actinoplanes sp. NPDC049118 TaxID=3155769 RepID=UPI0033CFF41D